MAPADGTARSAERRTVAVVGGGIAGLAAAWELSGGAAGPGVDTPRVIVLEASDQLGGKLRSDTFEGRPVDLGPDGFLGRRPEAAGLCAELGLDDLLRPVGASGAAVFTRGKRRPLPGKALALGIPTAWWPVARSGILGPAGSLRLLADLIFPRPDLRGPLGDRAIGPLVGRKLGYRVVDALVDPMIGGIHAGPVSDMSTAALFPLLLAVAQRRGSFMRSLRRAMANPEAAPPPAREDETDAVDGEDVVAGEVAAPEPPAAPPPLFWSLEGSVASLADHLADRLRQRDVVLRTGAAVELLDHLEAPERPWVLHTADGPVVADGLVLAVPAPAAAELLAAHDTEAATLLRGIDYSSVAVVTMAFDPDDVPELEGTGMIIPHGTPSPASLETPEPLLTTACTFLSTKWPHLARPGEVLLRASAGRYADDRPSALADHELVARVVAELGAVLGVTGQPRAWTVTRWDEAFPQYRVHHLLRVTGIESAVRRLPALAVCGAAYRGVGIPACVGSGRAAGRSVLDAMAGETSEAGPAS